MYIDRIMLHFRTPQSLHTHTHTHTHIYIYIYIHTRIHNKKSQLQLVNESLTVVIKQHWESINRSHLLQIHKTLILRNTIDLRQLHENKKQDKPKTKEPNQKPTTDLTCSEKEKPNKHAKQNKRNTQTKQRNKNTKNTRGGGRHRL